MWGGSVVVCFGWIDDGHIGSYRYCCLFCIPC
jgi:hypothetical protein